MSLHVLICLCLNLVSFFLTCLLIVCYIYCALNFIVLDCHIFFFTEIQQSLVKELYSDSSVFVKNLVDCLNRKYRKFSAC